VGDGVRAAAVCSDDPYGDLAERAAVRGIGAGASLKRKLVAFGTPDWIEVVVVMNARPGDLVEACPIWIDHKYA